MSIIEEGEEEFPPEETINYTNHNLITNWKENWEYRGETSPDLEEVNRDNVYNNARKFCAVCYKRTKNFYGFLFPVRGSKIRLKVTTVSVRLCNKECKALWMFRNGVI